MTVHLVCLSSDICEDDFEKGEGKSTGCGYANEKIGQSFDTFPQMLAYLEKTYGLSANEADYGVEGTTGSRQLHYSKTVADHSEEQNGGWFEPTEEELVRWRADALKLYSENYFITWHEVA